MFGAGEPEAVIAMVIESKAIADTFVTGRAFEVVFTEIVLAALKRHRGVDRTPR